MDSHTYRMGIQKNATDTILKIVMNQPGTFYRMNIIRDLNGVNKSLRYVFDNELWFRFLAKYGINTIGTTDCLFAHFRLHQSSKSVNEGYEFFNRESNDIWLYLAQTLNLNETIVNSLKQETLANYYIPDQWVFDTIEKSKIEYYFADKYLLALIDQDQLAIARKGWLHRLTSGNFRLNRMNVSTFVRAFIIPMFLKK
jgi:hypothetical protein